MLFTALFFGLNKYVCGSVRNLWLASDPIFHQKSNYMKAVIYDKQSGPVKLSYRDVEKPTPNENEILVEIHAVSVNAADYRMIQMGFPPKKRIFGADTSGIVEAVGVNVKRFKPGDHVIGDTSIMALDFYSNPIASLTGFLLIRFHFSYFFLHMVIQFMHCLFGTELNNFGIFINNDGMSGEHRKYITTINHCYLMIFIDDA